MSAAATSSASESKGPALQSGFARSAYQTAQRIGPSGQSMGAASDDVKGDGKASAAGRAAPSSGGPRAAATSDSSSCWGRTWRSLRGDSTSNACLFLLYIIAMAVVVVILVKTPATSLTDTHKVIIGVTVGLAPLIAFYAADRLFNSSCCKNEPARSAPPSSARSAAAATATASAAADSKRGSTEQKQ